MILIDNQMELAKICAALELENIISIDTEFERTNTYYARLSLIQMMSKNHQIVIDALAKLNLTPIKNLFANSKIVKIFHAPRQDFEIFYNIFGSVPVNIFDTQLAAEAVNLGKSLSYSDLCWQICQIKLDKANQFSNWLKRPISQAKLNYAINDVLYLEKIYVFLQKQIKENKAEHVYLEKINQLINLNNYKFDAGNAWKKVKCQKFSGKFKKRLEEIAAFREECARALDIPRRYFLTDDDLVKICKFLPTNELQIKNLNIKNHHLKNNKHSQRLREICLAFKEIEANT